MTDDTYQNVEACRWLAASVSIKAAAVSFMVMLVFLLQVSSIVNEYYKEIEFYT